MSVKVEDIYLTALRIGKYRPISAPIHFHFGDEKETFELLNVNLNILFRNLLTLSLLGSILKSYDVMQKSRLQKN